MQHPSALSDDELVARLSSVCAQSRALLTRTLLDLAEVETRNLHVKASYSSMFEYCRSFLKMSEGEAARRLCAARLARRFPSVLGRLERGDVHLSGLRILAKHQDEPDFEALLDDARGKTKREVLELSVKRRPRPELAFTIQELPSPTPAIASAALDAPAAAAAAPAPIPRPKIEPLAEARYGLQMTITAEMKEDLEAVTSLMRHRNPTGDERVVFAAALKALRRELEKERMAKTDRPHRKLRSSKPGHIAAATVRFVWKRDAEQCAWVGPDGRRCTCRDFLEIDHIEPLARGGSSEPENLRLLCRVHNRLHAEQCFGKEKVAEAIHCSQQQRRGKPLSPATVDASDPSLETAARSLLGLGFAKTDVRRVLDDIARRHAGLPEPPTLTALIRDGIAALT